MRAHSAPLRVTVSNIAMTLEFTSSEPTSSLTKFRLGSPLPTGAILEDSVSEKSRATTSIPPFSSVEQTGHGQVLLQMHLDSSCHIYGLGASQGGVNKRGRRYRMFAKDQAGYSPDLEALYASHPVLFLDGANPVGIFIDFAGEIVFDIDFTVLDVLSVRIAEPNFDLYVLKGASVEELISRFWELVGPPCVPPKWAFGYQQSRYSYPSAQRVQEIAQGFRDHDIPLDAIHVDIHYMDNYKIFTTHPERFPDFPGLVEDMSRLGVTLIPIIDPGVKIEEKYPAYENGIKEGVFCTDEKGKNYPAMVWPGYTYLPDFLNPKTQSWWTDCHREIVASGIGGLWNDMNEPAIFFTPDGFKGLRKLVTEAHEYGDFPGGAVDFLTGIMRFWHDERYYNEFYHTLETGERVVHQRVHNLYGASMAKATNKALLTLRPDSRPFVITRSSYIGSHRYCILWTGDNTSNWEDLLYHLRMLVSCGMVGFSFIGADIGGFEANTTPELLIRWTQAAIVSPFMRNHSILGSREQEPWLFGDKPLQILRDTIRLRYALIPYLYGEFLKSVRENRPFITGLFMEYSTPEALQCDDQILVGQSLMATPTILPNARGRFVHLPKHRWLAWNAARYEERICTVMEPGNHFIESDLAQTLFFIKEDSLIVLTPPLNSLRGTKSVRLIGLGLVNDTAQYVYVEDDGLSTEYLNGQRATLTITVQRTDSGLSVTHLVDEQGWKLGIKDVTLEIFDRAGSREILEFQL